MKKRRLILGFYVGAISLSVATLSMSIAWYASSTRLRIESILISIDCDRQLAISTQPDKGYKHSLSNDDLMECGLFTPVTSAHNEWISTKSDMPVFYDDTVYTEVEDAETSIVMEGGYFSQKLYLKSDDDVIVTIDPRDSYIKPNIEYNKAYARELHSLDDTYTVEEYESRLAHLVNAMRYSVLITNENDYDFIILDPNKSEDTYYGGILDNNDDDYYDSFIKDSDSKSYERVYGEINNKEFIRYDEPLSEDSDYENTDEEPSAFNARHRKGVYQFNLEKSLEAGLEIKKEESHTLEEFEGNNKPFTFPVYRDKPQEIVLSIYIEGWDLDSINYTKGATFNSNLTFMIEREK